MAFIFLLALAPRDARAQAPAAPTDLTAVGGAATVGLLWTKPGGTITGYEILYGKVGNTGSASWAAIPGSDANTVTHIVTGLDANFGYSFKIRAVNGTTKGAATDWVPGDPGESCNFVSAPTNLSITPGSDRLTITWTAPADPFRSGWVLDYHKPGGAWLDDPLAPTNSATSYTLTGLESDTEYEVELWAVLLSSLELPGCSALSDIVTATATTTNTPTTKIITLSTASASLSEGDSGTNPVTVTATLSEAAPAGFSISVTLDPAGSGTATGSSSNCTPPLQPADADYCFPGGSTVAIAEGGTQGTWTVHFIGDTRDEPDETIKLIGTKNGWTSGKLTLTIEDDDDPPAVPAAPTGLTATAGNAQVELSWTKPSGPITSYKLRYDKTGVRSSASWAAISSSGAGTVTHTVTSLENGSEYSFQIRAVNGAGDGTATGWVTATPISPTAKTITLSAPSTTIPEGDTGTTEVTVTATLGEAAPASFSLTIAPDFDPGTATGSGCTPPLTTGADYCLPDGNVVAIPEGETQGTWTVRILGDTRDESDETIHLLGGRNGWTSGKLTLTIQDDDDASPVLLAAPTDLTATAGDVQVELSWTRPSGTITSYQIRYDKTGARGGASWVAIPGSGAGTETHTVTGLDNGSDYSFQIRAVNGAGDGAATDWVTATPGRTIAPAAPTDLTATAGDAQVELSWTRPGGPITSYQIRYDKTGVRGSASWATISGSGAGTETHTVTSLDNGSDYSFQIRAVNGAGDGTATDWVTATPTLASGSVARTYYIDTANGSGSVCTRSAPCTLEEAFTSKQADEATFLIRVQQAGGKMNVNTPSMALTAAPIIFGAYVDGSDAAVEGTLRFTGANALLIAPTAQVKLDEQVRLEFKDLQVGTASDPAREEPIFFSGSGSEERISITGTLTINSSGSTVDHLVVSESFTIKGGAPLLVQGELRVPGDAVLTLESDLTVTDDVHLSSGTIRPYSGTMEFMGDLQVSGTGGLRTKRSGTEAERAIVIHGDFVQAKGTVTGSSGVALHPGTTKTVKGDFVVRDSTARYEADPGAVLTLEGAFHYAKEGKLNATLEFKGEEAQEVKTGAKTELHNVEVNNSEGVLLASSVRQQAAATLTLRQGRIMNADPTVSSTWTVKNPQIEENLQGRTSALEAERCGQDADRACRFSIARGSVQSHTLVPFTRHLEHGNSGDGVLSGGYLFPVGNTEERQVFYRPLILQLPSDLLEARAVTVTTMTDSEERLGAPLTVPGTSGESLILDVHAEMFWKIEMEEALESEVNLRVVAAGLRNVSDVKDLRLVQWDCEWSNPKLAGRYPASSPAGSFGVNDLLNGVVNLTQERITLEACTILGIAANSVENPIDQQELTGGRARIQFIHNLPGVLVPVDVYLGDLRIRSGLPFREATAYRTVGAAEYELTIQADGLPEDTAPDPVSLTLRNQRNYVVIAHGSTEDTRMKVLETQLESSVTTKADAVFVHGAADLGAVDVRVLNPSDSLTPLMVLADNLPFDGKTRYLALDASMHNVQVSSPNNAEEYEVFRMDLSGYGNETLVLNLSGSREDLRILGVDRNGMTFLPDVITGVETERAELPTEFALHGNYPNPFNPSTRIRFDLPETARVRVQIVDMLGREVMALPAQEFEAGTNQSIELNATNLASGTYLYRIIATGTKGRHVKAGRMTLVK